VLHKLEDALRAAFEGPFARLFPEKLHPLELASALREAMQGSRSIAPGGTYAHNEYAIRLNPQDYDALAGQVPAIEREVADYLCGWAEAQSLVVGPYLRVVVSADAAVHAGRAEYSSGFGEPPPARLEVQSGLPGRRVFEVGAQAIIGRGADCHVRLDEPNISRHHAELFWLRVQYEIRDLGSTNGTFVNGQPTQQAVLHDGDLLELGLVQVRFFTR